MEQNTYANIIWDWNGTLLNDIQLCVNIVNKLLSNHNIVQLDVESYKNVFGFPIRDYYRRIGVDFTKESFESLTVLIGDTIHDFDVSKELGVDCVLIARGHQSKKRLMDKTGGNARVIDHINQLKGVV